ncbi:MAG: ABC transporter permease [Proteobacteria bacterium]|nr:ABC transporter permease [Pseudomonadota bacterium]
MTGFQGFVAWRYLMARERRVSPPLLAVAGFAFIASAVTGGGNGVVSRGVEAGLAADWAYRNVLLAAVGLCGIGALGLLIAFVRYSTARPQRDIVPVTALSGFAMCAIGAAASSSPDELIRTWSVAFIVIGALGVALSAISCWIDCRAKTGGAMVLSGLMIASAGATVVVARYALAPMTSITTTYAPDRVLLPTVGLLVLGIGVALWSAIRYFSAPRRGRSTAGVALILLAASAVYPHAARSMLEADELLQYEPTGGHYAEYIFWASSAMLGAALGIAKVAIASVLLRRPRRPRMAIVAWFVALASCGGLGWCVSELVLTPPSYLLISPLRQGPNYTVLLISLGGFGIGMFAVQLAAVRYVFTFFTTVSIAGVYVGSMALVIVLSVMSGFETDLRDNILGSNAHILITKEEGPFTEYRDVATKIESLPGVMAMSPYLVSEVVVAASSNYSNVIIKGVDPATVGAVTELDDNIEKPPRALERLWPLAEDGSIIGPPSASDLPKGAGDGAEQGGDPGDRSDLPDPPPPDMDTDFGDPMDFSAGEPDQGEQPGERNNGETSGALPSADNPVMADLPDPPPPDMELDLDDPIDLSSDGPDIESGPEMEPDRVVRGSDSESIEGTGLDDRELRIPARVARLPGVLVGKELKEHLHIYVGQEVRVVSPLSQDTPAGPIPRTRPLRVAGIFFTGMYEYDLKLVYVPLPTLQLFLELGDEVTGIEIRIADPNGTEPVLRDIRSRLPAGYRVQDWKELNRNLFAALELEKIAMFLVLAIIILVASFSIVGNLIMIVIEKAKEIAILKTLGATSGEIMEVFVAQGFFIGLVGTIMGVSNGLVGCVVGSVYGIPLDPEVYYIDRLPIHIEPPAIAAVAVAGIAISVIATLYPAAVGARMRPVEGLRYE